MGFGERLQREREMRHITLEEIASATKIGSRSLRALEQEDFGKLPGGIFNKGFVRAYARYLGIDEEGAVADYMAAIGDPADPTLDGERLRKLEANWQPHKSGDAGDPIRVPWLGLALLILIAVVLFAGWHFRHQGVERFREWRSHRQHNAHQTALPRPASTAGNGATVSPGSASGTDPSPPAMNQPLSTALAPMPISRPPAPAALTQPQPGKPPEFVLQIHALEDSWISVVADGRSVFRGTLKAPGDQTIRARQKIMVTAGNAGGMELIFNGTPLPRFGEPQQVRTVSFTAQGLQPQNAPKQPAADKVETTPSTAP